MTIGLSELLSDTYGWKFAATGINKILSNNIYTSILITFCIILIIMIIYPCKKNTPLWVVFKLGFYILLCTTGILLVHDIILRKTFDDSHKQNTDNTFIKNIGGFNANKLDDVEISPLIDNIQRTGGGDAMDNEQIFSMYGV